MSFIKILIILGYLIERLHAFEPCQINKNDNLTLIKCQKIALSEPDWVERYISYF